MKVETYKTVKIEKGKWLKLKQLALNNDESLQSMIDKILEKCLKDVKE